MIDSKASQLNRLESAIALAIEEGDRALSKMPRMTITYGDQVWTDYQAPHRAFDGHFRAGTVDGIPLTQTDEYRSMRNCAPANARALLEQSPVSLAFGAWDSTRRSNQVRFRSAVVGEIIGVLVDQSSNGRDIPKRGGGRNDSISPSVRVSASDMQRLLEAQQDELSPKTVDEIRRSIAGAKKQNLSGSTRPWLDSPVLSTLGLRRAAASSARTCCPSAPFGNCGSAHQGRCSSDVGGCLALYALTLTTRTAAPSKL